MQFLKPKQLCEGHTLAIVSPSRGGPATFPHVYASGIHALEKLGFRIKEFPSARKDAQFLYEHPEFRAKDINAAFADTSVDGVIASIGGDDSVRILPFLDAKVLQKNPKFFLGYSDTTTLTTYLNQLGLVTFHGPSIMAGFSQRNSLDEKFHQHISDFLFGKEIISYFPFDLYSNGYPDRNNPAHVGKIKETFSHGGWHWLQGKNAAMGTLFGGCIEVLEFLKATDFWPQKKFRKNKLLFLETSEEKPPVEQVKRMLRNYGMQGVFEKISALLFGRPRDYSEEEKKQLDQTIVDVVRGEFKNNDLLIVSNMDFGHTDPQRILPLGIQATVDPVAKTFGLMERCFQN